MTDSGYCGEVKVEVEVGGGQERDLSFRLKAQNSIL